MFSRRSRIISFSCVVNDVIASVVAFILAYWIRAGIGQRGWAHLHSIYPFRMYVPVLLAAALVFPLAGYAVGAYQNIEIRRPRDYANAVVNMTLLGLFALFGGLFLLQGQYVSRGLLVAFAVLEFTILALSRWLMVIGGIWFNARPELRRHFVIVGTSPGAMELASLLREGEQSGFGLLALVHIGSGRPELPVSLPESYSILPLEQLSELLHTHVVDEVLFAVEREDLEKLEPLMQQCEEEGVHMRVKLDFLPKGFSHVFVEKLGHVPLLTFASAPQDDFALIFKRSLDVVFATLALLILSPFLALLAILVKTTSKGPVFFRQKRCGLGGRKFELLKFRSMVANADELLPRLEELNEGDGPVFKMRNDPRCTIVGRWMRMLSLDELPQLWNVVRGDMSLVGPRPPLPEEVERYEPWQRRRLRMRPGLTCLWALEGRSQLRFDRWVRLDLLYIDNWSVWLDFKIMLRTIPVVLSGRGAH